MAHDSELGDRIRRLLAAHPAVREVRMFGGLAFMVNGKLACSAHPDGALLLRVAPERVDELVGGGQATWGEMRGRRMGRGWLIVGAEHLAGERDLGRWLALALAHNEQAARRLP